MCRFIRLLTCYCLYRKALEKRHRRDMRASRRRHYDHSGGGGGGGYSGGDG